MPKFSSSHACMFRSSKWHAFSLKTKRIGMWGEVNLPWWLPNKPAGLRGSGCGFRRRRLCPSRRFLQLRFTSSNSPSRWNLQEEAIPPMDGKDFARAQCGSRHAWLHSEIQSSKTASRFLKKMLLHAGLVNLMVSATLIQASTWNTPLLTSRRLFFFFWN